MWISLTSSPISVPNIESQRWDVSFKLSTLNSAVDPELRDRKVEDKANATSSA